MIATTLCVFLQVHPIFMLSIADSLLASLWVIGGVMYLGKMSQHKVVCLFVSLLTVVRENLHNSDCVCVCLGLLLTQNMITSACGVHVCVIVLLILYTAC